MSDPNNTGPKTSTTAQTSGRSDPIHLSEADYLRHQAEEAKAAIAQALGQAKSALSGAVDPRDLTRTHPFVAIGSAAVAGFVAALLTIPSKEQQELRRMEKIHRAMHPEPAAAPKDTNGSAQPAPSLWATVLKEGITVLRPILVSAVTAGLNAQAHANRGQSNPTEPDIHPMDQGADASHS